MENKGGSALTILLVGGVLLAAYLLYQRHVANLQASAAQPSLVVQGAKAVGHAVSSVGSTVLSHITGAVSSVENAPGVGLVARGAIATGIKAPIDLATLNFGGVVHDLNPFNW